jgi:diaminobutyrate-2-oxoglutarate transaminase
LPDVIRMPYDGYLQGVDTLEFIEAMLFRTGSGVETPAAILLETVQAEGGINVASSEWLRGLACLAREHGVLLIVDDIQAGCGRTGTFFSFERAGIQPDLVCLAKSLSGYGLPMSLVLIRPELDRWEPGEHNGTFRGNNLAFETATAALEYWRDRALSDAIAFKSRIVLDHLKAIHAAAGDRVAGIRGLGLMQGLVFACPRLAAEVSKAAFSDQLIVELCGPSENVIKILPPLTIEPLVLKRGLQRLSNAISSVLGDANGAAAVAAGRARSEHGLIAALGLEAAHSNHREQLSQIATKESA